LLAHLSAFTADGPIEGCSGRRSRWLTTRPRSIALALSGRDPRPNPDPGADWSHGSVAALREIAYYKDRAARTPVA
jgi:hypothetical protein